MPTSSASALMSTRSPARKRRRPRRRASSAVGRDVVATAQASQVFATRSVAAPMPRHLRCLALAVVLLAVGPASPSAAQDETTNTAKSEERAEEHQAPEYQSELQRRSAENAASAAQIQASDPERVFVGDVCWHLASAC